MANLGEFEISHCRSRNHKVLDITQDNQLGARLLLKLFALAAQGLVEDLFGVGDIEDRWRAASRRFGYAVGVSQTRTHIEIGQKFRAADHRGAVSEPAVNLGARDVLAVLQSKLNSAFKIGGNRGRRFAGWLGRSLSRDCSRATNDKCG